MNVTKTRSAALCVALLAAAGCTVAHDWTSPSTPNPIVADRVERPQAPGWSGMVWAGPHSGAPAMPSARDCRRAPQQIELAGPEPMLTTQLRGRGDFHRSARLEAAPTAPAALAEAKKGAGSAATAMADSAAPPVPSAPVMQTQPTRPAHEPVTAGVVDDNADFGEYLAYRARSGGLNVRQRDISERYRLVVHDAAGRPVPDAMVSVHAASRALPLWARTDSAGQAWLFPRAAGIGDSVLEVRVSKAGYDGETRGVAFLKRGQRDQVQVRLASHWAVERARLDLVFLVDATGSMGDEIDKLKRSMRSIADQVAALPSQPELCFGLVAYRDRGDEFFVRAWDFSHDLGAFQQALAGVHANGGGDYPEALNEALHTAVHRLSWRGDGATRLVVLVADAPPHLDYGAPGYEHDMQGALARGIKLFAVGASGLDKSGEYIYRQMAQYTGGRFIFLTYDKAHNPASGPGRETVHDVSNYSVETLDKLVVRLVREELAKRPT
jgi:Mg-chelatase subunit ChlD